MDMDSQQLEALRKWSEGFTRSAWAGVSQMLKGFQLSPPPAGSSSAGDMLTRLMQLNQLTLSIIEQFRNWEKLNEQIAGFNQSILGGLGLKPDNRIQELESEIDMLKTKLNEQESVLQELQKKLQSAKIPPADATQTTKILSEFLSEQSRQFQKLVQKEK